MCVCVCVCVCACVCVQVKFPSSSGGASSSFAHLANLLFASLLNHVLDEYEHTHWIVGCWFPISSILYMAFSVLSGSEAVTSSGLVTSRGYNLTISLLVLPLQVRMLAARIELSPPTTLIDDINGKSYKSEVKSRCSYSTNHKKPKSRH